MRRAALFIGLLLIGTPYFLFGQQLAGYKFIENKGQWEPSVNFRADIRCGFLYLENDGLLFNLYDAKEFNKYVKGHFDKEQHHDLEGLQCHAYTVKFLNMNEDYSIFTELQTPEYYNYNIGRNKNRWASKAHGFHRTRYENLYKNIDLQFYSKVFNLKYDFIVKPGGNPSEIKLEYDGADELFIKDQRLYIKTSVNTVIEDAPYAYQIINDLKVDVPCRYSLHNNTLHFVFPKGYNEAHELIIDPTLMFSTYSGSFANNFGYTATFDSKGFLYSGSSAFGIGYPTNVGAYQENFKSGIVDYAISKYDTSGTFMVWSTYMGGSDDELPHSLIVNASDEIFIMGSTSSFDYPVTTSAYDTSYNGGVSFNPAVGTDYLQGLGVQYNNGSDIFISRLSSDGANLMASTLIGGTENDGLNWTNPICGLNVLRYNYADEVRGEIDIDENDNIYVVSSTRSTDFPTTTGAFQENYGGGDLDGCVFKMDNNLTSLIWSSFYGGNKHDAAYSLSIDSNNDLYIAGGTSSDTLLTTTNVLDTNFQGGRADGFITHIASDGTTVLGATYYGSSEYDQIYFVELDRYNNVYIFGQTEAPDSTFIHNAGYSTANSGQMLSKKTPALDSLIYSTVFGTGIGGPNISPTAFLVDLCNKIYLSGWGGGTNQFATCNAAGLTTGMDVTLDAHQSTTDGSDFYVMVLEDDASSLVYGSFMGGGISQEHVDGGTSRFDRKGKVYQSVCAGCSYPLPGNSDFPIEPPGTAVGPINNSNCNNAVFKMDFNLPIVVADFDTPPIGCEPFTYTFNNTSVSQNFTSYYWDFGDSSASSTTLNPTHTYTSSGTYTVTLIVSDTATCNFGDTISKLITILGDTTYSLSDIAICPGQTEQIGLLPNPDTSIVYEWILGANSLTDSTVSNPFTSPISTTNYTLLIHSGVCTDTVNQTVLVNLPLLSVSNDTVLCNGSNSTTLFANSFGTSTTYIWSSNNHFSDTLNTNITSDSLNVSPTIPSTYYVQISNNGCTLGDSIFVNLASSQIELLPNLIICEGDTVTLDVTNLNPSDTLSYDWSNDLDIISGDSTDVIVVAPIMDTWFYIESENSAGCLLTDSVLITVSNLPSTSVFATADYDTIPTGVSVGLHATPGGYSYSWSPASSLNDANSQDPIATPSGTTTYYVTITDGPCSKQDSITIVVADIVCGQPDVYVPNAFTPDGNGNNDVVRVRGNNIKELIFRIYDRWGELVFETTNQAIGWDGSYKNRPGDPAVYVYYLDIICIDDEAYFEKGNITLIR